MAFTSFKNSAQVIKNYHLYFDSQNFISVHDNAALPSPALISTIDFNLRETMYDTSEAALCESLIFPVLQDIWKHFMKDLFLWSHTTIEADENLTGIPDYLIAKKSEFGRILGTPLLTTVEAKKDNFEEGWTQCIAQMVAMQKINVEKGNFTVYGIVTNGELWEMARLQDTHLLKNTTAYTIFDLPKLYAVLYSVLSECHKQILAH